MLRIVKSGKQMNFLRSDEERIRQQAIKELVQGIYQANLKLHY